MTSYAEFLAAKRRPVVDSGRVAEPDEIHPSLFEFQRDITLWALRKGRAAIFADTGLGKTRMQVEWARLTGERSLILAPLTVAQQTVAEAAELGVEVVYARYQDEATDAITITNYERLHRFDPAAFGAVVLDESSILKSFDGATRKALCDAFARTPHKLACTATPAPNDLEEIGNHAEFVGVCSRVEMLSRFFVHDDSGWRIKRHARSDFFRWLASWAMAIKRPSDLGYDDADFQLPGLNIVPHFVAGEWTPDETLFVVKPKGVKEISAVRRATMPARVDRVAELVNGELDEQWLVWCGLNDEGRNAGKLIPDSVVVEGSDTPEEKADALAAFVAGKVRVIVTKPKIAGFGMNFQNCARMAFLGLGHSYEQYYQALRRCHRFGQQRQVDAHVVLADVESDIFESVLAKEAQAAELSAGLLEGARDFERAELAGIEEHRDTFEPRQALRLPDWMEAA